MKRLLLKAFSKPLKILVVILASILSLTISLSISQMSLPTLIQISGFKMHSFSKQLFNTPLPENTTLIEKTTSSYIFNYNRNGNYHEYAAVLLVESDLSLAELNSYYASATSSFLTANDLMEAEKNPYIYDDAINYLYYDVSPVTESPYFLGFPYSDYYGEAMPIKFKHLKDKTEHTNLYYVAIHDDTDNLGQME